MVEQDEHKGSPMTVTDVTDADIAEMRSLLGDLNELALERIVNETANAAMRIAALAELDSREG